jgi:rod shape determining protein RodA
MRQQTNLKYSVDWVSIFLYFALVIFGWINIYAAVYDPEAKKSIFDMTINSGRQLVWILTAILLIIMIMVIDFKFYETLAFVIYALTILLLIAVLFFGREIAGSKSWFDLGFIRLQPAEFGKTATAIAIAKYLDSTNAKLDDLKPLVIVGILILMPAVLVLLQGDTGSAIVYASFIILLYREGFHNFFMVLGIFLVLLFIATIFLRYEYMDYLLFGIGILGIIGLLLVYFSSMRKKWQMSGLVLIGCGISLALVLSVDYIISDIMLPHQQKRIDVLVNPDSDPLGAGWQITQAKIAIGSGGVTGKGFLKGTQTKFDFVPDQSTDFIFCTVGEEYGWLGSLALIVGFTALFFRITYLAERQKSRFVRVYGYGVVGVLFFHFMVNMGMAIGLFPVIGIPLPFFSYGGSSLWAFTILLFIFLKLDAHRNQVLARH